MTENAGFMVTVAERTTESRQDAIRVVRAILRHLGGQKLYLPAKPLDASSRVVDELRGIVADELGDARAEKFLTAFLQVFNGDIYLPLERGAFRDEIADEIFTRYNGTNEMMAELCREHRTTFTQIYRLYKIGRDRRRRPVTPDLFSSLDNK